MSDNFEKNINNLIQALSAFLTPLPCFADEPSRRALLIHAGLSDLLPSANLSGSAYQCVASILHDFEQYDRTDALVQFLREIRNMVGGEKQAECDAQYKELLQRLEVIQCEDAEVARLKTEARQTIEDGKFDAAETNANNARLQEIRLRYAKAADY